MAFEKLIVERDGDVAIICINDPASLNALTVELCEELNSAFDAAACSSRAIILTGEGRAFCSGANLDPSIPLPEDFGLVLDTHVNPLMLKLRDLPVPWISAVRGAAAGVGCALALAADLIVASESAFFLQAFVRIGLSPDGGSSHLLMRAVGRARAMEMMMLGERIAAAQALEWGLINRLTSEEQLSAEALGLARKLAQGPTRSLGLIRRLGWTAADQDFETTLKAERITQNSAGRTADALEAITAFQEKRPARFTGA